MASPGLNELIENIVKQKWFIILCFSAKRLKSQRRSRGPAKTDLLDQRLKEKLRSQELLDNDKDETSSTTTDSSSAEPEEKVSATYPIKYEHGLMMIMFPSNGRDLGKQRIFCCHLEPSIWVY